MSCGLAEQSSFAKQPFNQPTSSYSYTLLFSCDITCLGVAAFSGWNSSLIDLTALVLEKKTASRNYSEVHERPTAPYSADEQNTGLRANRILYYKCFCWGNLRPKVPNDDQAAHHSPQSSDSWSAKSSNQSHRVAMFHSGNRLFTSLLPCHVYQIASHCWCKQTTLSAICISKNPFVSQVLWLPLLVCPSLTLEETNTWKPQGRSIS